MKGEMLLKLAKLPYRTDTRGFPRAPKGKLPYIVDDGEVIADSTLIRLHLERKASASISTAACQRAIAAWRGQRKRCSRIICTGCSCTGAG
jgi:glutathione S-transferase